MDSRFPEPSRGSPAWISQKNAAALGAGERHGYSLATVANSGLGLNEGKVALERVMERDAASDRRRVFIVVEHLAVLRDQVSVERGSQTIAPRGCRV